MRARFPSNRHWFSFVAAVGFALAGCGSDTPQDRPTQVIEDGLTVRAPVAHYSFDSCRGRTMASVPNVVGGGADGTATGGVRCVAGRVGRGAAFDGADDIVEIPDTPQLAFSDALTVSAWVRPAQIGGSQTIVGKWFAPDQFLLWIENGNFNFRVTFPGGTWGAPATVSAPALAEEWTHLAGVFDGQTASLYVNGVLAGETYARGTLQASNRPVTIGGWPSWNAYRGRIDEVKLFDVALSSDEVAALGRPCGGNRIARIWYRDSDRDGLGNSNDSRIACSRPRGYVATGGDNCAAVFNPGQLDADGDGYGDVCPNRATACGDLVEENISARWSTGASDLAPSAIAALSDPDVVRGRHALRWSTDSGFDAWARYDAPAGRPLNASGAAVLRMVLRAVNTNPPTWQGNFPVVVLEDTTGSRRSYSPSLSFLDHEGLFWRVVEVPLAGSVHWSPSGDAINFGAIRAIEIHADTWERGFHIDIDGVGFETANATCPLRCPGDCSARGVCRQDTATCDCPAGAAPPDCADCGSGFALVPGTLSCGLENDGAYDYWPNPVSIANSDPWLAMHRDEVRVLRPNLLALLYANPGTYADEAALVNQLVAAYAEASRARGYADPSASPQLEYQPTIVDLRDQPPPAAWQLENSTLWPRRPAGTTGVAYTFDYAALFSDAYAPHLGYPDPDNAGQYLDLCTLVERGLVHELWLVGSSDPLFEGGPSDVSIAEVLEHKPAYDANGNKTGAVSRCAGNGCYDLDVPYCARSLRIGYINYRRGPGCFLESKAHGVESTGGRRVIPALTEWFVPFAGWDLDQRYGLPFASLGAVAGAAACPGNEFGPDTCHTHPDHLDCIEYPTPTRAVIRYGASSEFVVDPFDPVCGFAHHPPNAEHDYDFANCKPFQTSCTGFGRHAGPGGSDALEIVNSPNWGIYSTYHDCGGPFLVWWHQNMPAFGSGQTFADGRPMMSIWPALFL